MKSKLGGKTNFNTNPRDYAQKQKDVTNQSLFSSSNQFPSVKTNSEKAKNT